MIRTRKQHVIVTHKVDPIIIKLGGYRILVYYKTNASVISTGVKRHWPLWRSRLCYELQQLFLCIHLWPPRHHWFCDIRVAYTWPISVLCRSQLLAPFELKVYNKSVVFDFPYRAIQFETSAYPGCALRKTVRLQTPACVVVSSFKTFHPTN